MKNTGVLEIKKKRSHSKQKDEKFAENIDKKVNGFYKMNGRMMVETKYWKIIMQIFFFSEE